MSSNVDSAVSPGSHAGTGRQDFDTALSPTDDIDSGIQGLKTGCGTDTGRVIAAVPRRRLVGLSRQRPRRPSRSRRYRLAKPRTPAPLAVDLTLPLPAAGRTATPVLQPGRVETQARRLQERGRAGAPVDVGVPDTREALAAGGFPIHPCAEWGDLACVLIIAIGNPPFFSNSVGFNLIRSTSRVQRAKEDLLAEHLPAPIFETPLDVTQELHLLAAHSAVSSGQHANRSVA